MGNDLHFETFPLLEPERLILRELRPADAETVFRLLSDDEVVRYYDPLMTHLEQGQRRIERHRARFENNEGIRWGITIKGEDTIVGNCGFFRGKDNFSAALSYVLAKSSWNKGFMPEALEAIIAFGFEHYQLHRIEAPMLPDRISPRYASFKSWAFKRKVCCAKASSRTTAFMTRKSLHFSKVILGRRGH